MKLTVTAILSIVSKSTIASVCILPTFNQRPISTNKTQMDNQVEMRTTLLNNKYDKRGIYMSVAESLKCRSANVLRQKYRNKERNAADTSRI